MPLMIPCQSPWIREFHYQVTRDILNHGSRSKCPSAKRHFGSRRKTFRGKGFLFCTRLGKPISPTNIIRRHLHPALKQLNYVNQFNGTHKAGNHAFRRFRITYLRNKTECPEGLRNYWMAHAGNSMSDLYDKIKEDVQFRKLWAEKCGFGFELPSVVPNVPKSSEKTEVQIAA
jgi:hypothetical protein